MSDRRSWAVIIGRRSRQQCLVLKVCWELLSHYSSHKLLRISNNTLIIFSNHRLIILTTHNDYLTAIHGAVRTEITSLVEESAANSGRRQADERFAVQYDERVSRSSLVDAPDAGKTRRATVKRFLPKSLFGGGFDLLAFLTSRALFEVCRTCIQECKNIDNSI